jgi:23S rRNA (adenine(2503)-C(2))-methyltransferase
MVRDIKRIPLLEEASVAALFDELKCSRDNMKKLWREFLSDVDCDFTRLPHFPKKIANAIDERFVRISSTVSNVQESADGTIKLLVKLQDGHEVETVIIDHSKSGNSDDYSDGTDKRKRVTLCVSSQVGCRMACAFCATGTLGLSGNLLAGEILEQLWHALQFTKRITNIVFMGMGEPLENYEAVVSAIRGFTDRFRFNIGDQSITVSTVGVTSNIYRLMEDCPSVNLALSLHAPNQKVREKIVPTAKSWPLHELIRAIDYYNNNQKYKGKKRGRIMIEYVVIRDVNDSEQCAHELGILLSTRKCMINLIPFNKFEGNPFEEPEESVLDRMVDIVSSYGIVTIKRMHHGRDIAGACGQLAKTVLDDVEDTQRSCFTPTPRQPEQTPLRTITPAHVALALVSYLVFVAVSRQKD